MEKSPAHVLLGDPLTEVTRKERRSLLGVSTVGLAVALTGLTPEAIPAAGLEFSSLEQVAFQWLLIAVICYYAVAFITYGGSDYLAWRIRYRRAQQDVAEESRKSSEVTDGLRPPKNHLVRRTSFYKMAMEFVRPMSVARALVDFLLPLIVAFAAALALVLLPGSASEACLGGECPLAASIVMECIRYGPVLHCSNAGAVPVIP